LHIEQKRTAYSSAQCHSSEIDAKLVFTNQTTRPSVAFKKRRGEDEMNPVAEMKTKTNATPESGSANGGKTQDTGSKTSTAAAMGTGTNVTFGATAGMPGRFKGNFDYQFVRTMGCVTYGGAALGECYETASRIEDERESSYTEAWQVTAERAEAIRKENSKLVNVAQIFEDATGRKTLRRKSSSVEIRRPICRADIPCESEVIPAANREARR
jgi:hypothetical protein